MHGWASRVPVVALTAILPFEEEVVHCVNGGVFVEAQRNQEEECFFLVDSVGSYSIKSLCITVLYT